MARGAERRSPVRLVAALVGLTGALWAVSVAPATHGLSGAEGSPSYYQQEPQMHALSYVRVSRQAASNGYQPQAGSVAQTGPSSVTAVAHSLGAQRLIFSAEHPDAELSTVLDRLGYPAERRGQAGTVDLAVESFEVVVPQSYSERVAKKPWGLFIWISPTAQGGMRHPEVRKLLAKRRLIWIGANGAGNERPYWQRIQLALAAASSGSELWDVDTDRIFVGGYSGGGRVSSMAAWLWPEVFKGAVFWMGVEFFEPVAVPDEPGRQWNPRFRRPTSAQRELIRDRSRFAFVTGDEDFNRAETEAIFSAVQRLGYKRSTYIQIPGADHFAGVSAKFLGRALGWIDR